MRSLRSPLPISDLAHRRLLLLPLAALAVEQPRRQHRHRLRAVAVLRAVVLALDDEPGRQVRDAHRGVGLVDVLAARARRAEGVDAQVGRIDRDVGDRIGLRHHRDRARRRVDAPLRLGLRHALHAMAARLELELRVRALPTMRSDHLLVAAELGRRRRDDLDLPALRARRSACTCGNRLPANSADSSPPVPARISRKTLRSSFGILRQQHPLQVGLERRHPRLRRRRAPPRRTRASPGSRAISSAVGEVVLGAP